MNQPPKLNRPPNRPQSVKNKDSNQNKPKKNHDRHQDDNQNEIVKTMIDIIDKLETDKKTFKDYPIRDLVKHSEDFGGYLKSNKLETNQIRKFLDAINRLKVKLTQAEDSKDENRLFQLIEPEIVLLKPKLAYAAARLTGNAEKAAKNLSKVMGTAIDRVLSLEDFERLVQFMESIIAYHKAAGGK